MELARRPTRLDRVAYVVRGDGVTSAVLAAGLIGFVAGLLDASEIPVRFWVYVLVWPLLTVVVLALRQRSVRLLITRLLFRRRDPGADDSASAGTEQVPSVGPERHSWVDVMSTPDVFYRTGFASMRHGNASPLLVTPSNPRDISRPDDLTQRMFVPQWDGQPISVHLGAGLDGFSLIRSLPQAHDADHTFASRDVCYLPELGAELLQIGSSARPLARPEHCLDAELAGTHDLVVVSGPDTNFWHAALFEAVTRRFEQPQSVVPLGAGLRDVSSGGIPVYGSSDLFVRLRHASAAVERHADERGVVRLAEVMNPTYGFLLLATNPLSTPACPRWCVFVAGLRSVGTMAASLVLASMLRALRTETVSNVWSAVPVSDSDGDLFARSAVLLVRAATVEAAATKHEPRLTRAIPHDRRDPDYRDSYVVTGAEVLDTTGPHAMWRRVTADSFPSDVAAWSG